MIIHRLDVWVIFGLQGWPHVRAQGFGKMVIYCSCDRNIGRVDFIIILGWGRAASCCLGCFLRGSGHLGGWWGRGRIHLLGGVGRHVISSQRPPEMLLYIRFTSWYNLPTFRAGHSMRSMRRGHVAIVTGPLGCHGSACDDWGPGDLSGEGRGWWG